MPYRLRDEVSFCRVDGHLIFLDVLRDRYFLLSERAERTVISLVDGGEVPQANLRELVNRNVLTEIPLGGEPLRPATINTPRRSATEQQTITAAPSIATVINVLAIVGATQLQLKTRSLKRIMDGLVQARRNCRSTSDTYAIAPPEQEIIAMSRTFMRTRLYVPIATCCLLDSLAMTKFLTNKGLHANLVFGVCANPFAAHCWVQAGDLVLNDAVGNVNAYTPIRVV